VAPWNFPLAILTGLTSHARPGNCVIIKPRGQTSIIGAFLMDILVEPACPRGAALSLLLRRRRGAHLVAHPRVDFIAFTGIAASRLRHLGGGGQNAPRPAHLKKSCARWAARTP